MDARPRPEPDHVFGPSRATWRVAQVLALAGSAWAIHFLRQPSASAFDEIQWDLAAFVGLPILLLTALHATWVLASRTPSLVLDGRGVVVHGPWAPLAPGGWALDWEDVAGMVLTRSRNQQVLCFVRADEGDGDGAGEVAAGSSGRRLRERLASLSPHRLPRLSRLRPRPRHRIDDLRVDRPLVELVQLVHERYGVPVWVSGPVEPMADAGARRAA